MIIVGVKKTESSFADMFLAYLQRYVKKRRAVFSLYGLSSYEDLYSLKNHLYDKKVSHLFKEPKISMFSGLGRKSLSDQIEELLRNYKFELSMVKVDNTYSCIGVDFLDCLKKIDFDSTVRWAYLNLLLCEASNVWDVWRKGGEERFFDFISKEEFNNFILKDEVIREYGNYDVRSMANFCCDIGYKDKKMTEIDGILYHLAGVLPKNTPVEKEIKNALMQKKIIPVFRTGRKSGKTHAFKGFIPFIMVDNDTQKVYTSGGFLHKKGKDLIGSMSRGEITVSGESYFSDYEGDYVDTPLSPILSKNTILYKPTNYEGNTFKFEYKTY